MPMNSCGIWVQEDGPFFWQDVYIVNGLLELLDFAYGTLFYVYAEFSALEMEGEEQGQLGGQEEAGSHWPASYT
jgi:hypothetical protein